jgi:UDP-N-acetylmuramoyl-L-alanyl-D-glutamate--2,6-diaminopimelate ligase
MTTPRALSTILSSSDLFVRDVVPSLAECDPAVSGVTLDSRQVGPGSLFCAVRGAHHDAHAFVADAARAGAVGAVVERRVDAPLTQVVVDDSRVATGLLAASFYDHPSAALTMVGITGTNGKTTTAHLVAGALEALGQRTGVIGTLSGAHTTPESPDLQRRLAAFRDEGCAAVAMEVSSHALALDRVVGTRFDVGIFTNLGRDHLDLHGTQEAYFAAKARLFEPDLTAEGVVNVDDEHGRRLAAEARIPIAEFSIADAGDIEIGPRHHAYTWRGVRVRVALGGRFNVLNSLAAATALAVLGHSPDAIAGALASSKPVRGRFEPVDAGQPFTVVVDYAHTPDALGEVLRAARELAGGHSVTVVFGCGGDRDRAKRPEMGEVAARRADRLLVTSDNPRSEDPSAIINDIIAGVPTDYRGLIVVEPDRRAAISAALGSARQGDVVVLAGKGHETTQTFGSTVLELDDRAVALDVLRSMIGGRP